jgi:DNA-binding NarL/FixJ family response regulator/anti-sigma regulatory factor (Ser/Thr protein kinase)
MKGDALSSRRLLVIEPDRSSHEILRAILERGDRSVQGAFGKSDAEASLRTSPYDVVVTGQGCNGFDGLRMARRVRALQPDARVILTGDSAQSHVIGALRARVFGYCHNPPPDGPLNDLVAQALDAASWQNDILVISASPQWITLDIRCKMEAGDRATYFVRELDADLPAHVRDDVSSAFRELLYNAIEHGGKYNPKKRVRVCLIRTEKALIVQIHDPGKGFSMNALPHAAISNPADSPIRHVEVRAEAGQRPGGFGILMTRSLVDELIYNERGNGALFIKYL